MSSLQLLARYSPALLAGLWVTLRLCGIAWAVGLAGGVPLGWAAARLGGPIAGACRAVGFVLAGVPVLVLLFWVHYPLQASLGVVVDPFYTAALVLAGVNLFAVAELVRPAVAGFPAEYLAAARVCGLSPGRTFARVQLPLLARQLFSPLLVQQIAILQASLLSSLIGVNELFRTAQRINSVEYLPVQVYTLLAAFLLAVCGPLFGLAYWLGRGVARDLSDR